jgi:hypothetical protein
MILTGENRFTIRKTCPSVTVFTTNPTLAGWDSVPGIRGENGDSITYAMAILNSVP